VTRAGLLAAGAFGVALASALAGPAGSRARRGEASQPRPAPAAPRNVVFILGDDHRFDFMSFVPGHPPFLTTPQFDRMAAGGAHLGNAFVTTSLCSPSRASILTGQYAHRHRIVDNTSPIPPGTAAGLA
jgi:arylsulfatase A-like enzyme